MTFTLTGLLENGLPAELTWSDGEIAGTPAAVVRVEEALAFREEVWQTPTGPSYRAALRPAKVAALTMRLAFVADVEITGDLPDLTPPELPRGAVA